LGRYADGKSGYADKAHHHCITRPVDIKIDTTVMNGRITYMASEKGFYHH